MTCPDPFGTKARANGLQLREGSPPLLWTLHKKVCCPSANISHILPKSTWKKFCVYDEGPDILSHLQAKKSVRLSQFLWILEEDTRLLAQRQGLHADGTANSMCVCVCVCVFVYTHTLYVVYICYICVCIYTHISTHTNPNSSG